MERIEMAAIIAASIIECYTIPASVNPSAVARKAFDIVDALEKENDARNISEYEASVIAAGPGI